MPKVVEQAEGWEINESEDGITATRRFILASSYPSVFKQPQSVDLPKVGDLFVDSSTSKIIENTSFAALYCRSVEISPMADDKRAPEYICTYSNDPTDKEQFDGSQPNVAVLPKSAIISGEYELLETDSITGVANGWKWKSSNDPVNQGIPIKTPTATMRIVRIVNDSTYNSLQQAANALMGQVNKSAMSLFGASMDPETVIFNNMTAEKFLDYNSEAKWKCELEFVFRLPDWNKQINRTIGWWGTPSLYDSDAKKFTTRTYLRNNLEILFTNNPTVLPGT